MTLKIICDECMGNGYIRVWEDKRELKKVTIQCTKCDSEGEVEINEENVFPARKDKIQ